jgi:hypothetical protein
LLHKLFCVSSNFFTLAANKFKLVTIQPGRSAYSQSCFECSCLLQVQCWTQLQSSKALLFVIPFSENPSRISNFYLFTIKKNCVQFFHSLLLLRQMPATNDGMHGGGKCYIGLSCWLKLQGAKILYARVPLVFTWWCVEIYGAFIYSLRL